jgi:cytochrome c-type biogenesis protein CcmH
MRSKNLLGIFKTWMQISALCLLTAFAVGAGDPSARFNTLGHKLMCSCGCGQVLLECNHVGCPSSEGMRDELTTDIARGDSDGMILDAFVQKYGPTVLSSPTRGGFDRVVWIIPPVVILLAALGAAIFIRRWRLRTVSMPEVPAGTSQPEIDTMRDRIRRDTEDL